MSLARHASDETKLSWPSTETISRETGLSERQVQRHLRTLLRRLSGSITRQLGGGRHRTNTYRLDLEPETVSSATPLPNGSGVIQGQKGCHLRSETVSSATPESVSNQSEPVIDTNDPYLAEAARLLNITVEEIRQAMFVKENDPALYEKLRRGEISIDAAVSMITKPTVSEPEPSRQDATQPELQIYAFYPRKVGKRAAIGAISKAIARLTKNELPTGKLDDSNWPQRRHEAIAFLLNRTKAFCSIPSRPCGEILPASGNMVSPRTIPRQSERMEPPGIQDDRAARARHLPRRNSDQPPARGEAR